MDDYRKVFQQGLLDRSVWEMFEIGRTHPDPNTTCEGIWITYQGEIFIGEGKDANQDSQSHE